MSEHQKFGVKTLKEIQSQNDIQKVWDNLGFILPKTQYKEFGERFVKFEFEGKKYKLELKEVKK